VISPRIAGKDGEPIEASGSIADAGQRSQSLISYQYANSAAETPSELFNKHGRTLPADVLGSEMLNRVAQRSHASDPAPVLLSAVEQCSSIQVHLLVKAGPGKFWRLS
jgi:hypothetical protein